VDSVPPRIAIEHRLGELSLGDVSVAIAVSHARRAPALDACRYVIEELKKRVPIWKREHYADGSRAWVDNRNTVGAVELPGVIG
jgi:molybdopterin synthase catalytic subunit